MQPSILLRSVRSVVLALLLACAVQAAPHNGQVRFAGLPLPGAIVTASQGEKQLSAITDQQGSYYFPDLADGLWKVRVEMSCFEPATLEVAIAANAPPAQWELKMLPLESIHA